MKKLLALFLSTLTAAAVMTGCSAADGRVDDEGGANAGTSRTTTMNGDRNDRTTAGTTSTSRREISDDIADGINDGLDKTQSVVDDILK